MINYQTAVIRGDMEAAAQILPKIPKDNLNQVAQFLEKQGHKELAMEIATDFDIKFELAIQLKKLGTAYQLAKEANLESKWKQLGDIALSIGELGLARECLIAAQDLSGLLLLCCSTGDMNGLRSVAAKAKEDGQNNISFVSSLLSNQVNDCLNLLCSTNRVPEAAFLARTYVPSQVSNIVGQWKQDLKQVNEKAADSLADPNEYPNLFPDFDLALKAEQVFKQKPRPANMFSASRADAQRNLIEEVRSGNFAAPSEPEPEPEPVKEPEPEPEPVLVPEPAPVPEPVAEEPTKEPEQTETLDPADEDIDIDDLLGDEDLDGQDIAVDDLDLDI